GAGLTQLVATATSGGAIQIQDAQYGSAAGFTVSGDSTVGPNGISAGTFGLNGTYAGVDMAGTIDGQAATGAGQVLTSSTGASSGLQLRVTATADDVAGAGGSLSLGSASFSQGIAGRLSSFLTLTQGVRGSITDATNVYNSSIQDVQKQIAAMQVQLSEKETVLRQQFATMEAALVKLQSQGNFISSQLGMGTSASSSPTGSNSTSGSSGG
ncbi:MAG TPA: flagellar filament capping protein FliD, partial [Actinomycetota bacterium]|nr:flagellar filament capping protein FliD [Actinomycetota bacterium]